MSTSGTRSNVREGLAIVNLAACRSSDHMLQLPSALSTAQVSTAQVSTAQVSTAQVSSAREPQVR